MTLYWREKVLLLKTETVYGTDSVPTGAANAILATDVTFMPMEGQDVERELELPWLGAQASVVAALHAKISFKVELKGSGAVGTAPAFGPALLAACMAEVVSAGVSVTYSKVSGTFAAATIYFAVNGIRYVMIGCRGNCVQRVNAQGIVYLEFEFTGLFSQPMAQTLPVPTYGTQLTQMPQVASRANTPVFTLGGTSYDLRSFSLDWGNQVEPRMLIGSEEIVVPAISEQIAMTIEAVPLATLNPYALAAAGTTLPLVLTHGTGAGRIATLNVARLMLQRPKSLANNQGVVEWPLEGKPLPLTGQDQFTLVFT